MKTTDEMILDLVEAGFVLPEGLGFNTVGKFWRVKGEPHAICGFETIPDQLAHDLCACEFARQWSERHGLSSERPPMHASLGYGDTEGAIKALWKGVCDG